METNTLSRALALFALAGASMTTFSACATVSPEEMESEISQLRSEVQQNQERVESLEGRIDDVEQSAEQRMNELEQSLSGIRDEFGGEIERMGQAIRFSAPIYFDFDDATILDQGMQVLDRFVQIASEYYPDAVITVEGLTDPVGPEAYNIWLGQERADNVREYLVSNGLDEAQVRAVSYGADAQRLIVPAEGGPDEGWQNRRVVLVIDHSEAARQPMQPSAEGG